MAYAHMEKPGLSYYILYCVGFPQDGFIKLTNASLPSEYPIQPNTYGFPFPYPGKLCNKFSASRRETTGVHLETIMGKLKE